MSVDLRWDLLTDSSRNFGNALVGAAAQVRQRRDQSRDREAVSNYLVNPTDASARQRLVERNPEMAFRIEDRQLERARALRGDQQQQLQYLGRILRDVQGDADYPAALDLARRAGIDVTGHETYDPNFVGQIQELDRRLNRQTPVNVAEGAQLVDPETGRVVASTPQRPRYYAIQPGGRLELDPSYQGPVIGEQPATAPAPRAEAPAFSPAPMGAPSEFANVPSGSPLQGGGQNLQLPRVRNEAEYAALPPGTEYLDPNGNVRRKAQ